MRVLVVYAFLDMVFSIFYALVQIFINRCVIFKQ
jgi:hypothetical protein